MSYLSNWQVDGFNDTPTRLELAPYGSAGAQIFFSLVFMIWILLANLLVFVLVFKTPALRRQPHNLYTAFLCMCDLTVALFYLPINMDFLAKEVWDHGCTLLNLWVVYLLFNLCACSFTVFMLNFSRLLSTCPCFRSSPPTLRTRFILHGLSLFLILLYYFMTVLSFWNANGITSFYDGSSPDQIGLYGGGETIFNTRAVLNQFQSILLIVIGLVAFWAPMYFALLCLGIALYRIPRPRSQEQLKEDESRLPVKVLVLVTMVSVLMPGQYVLYTSVRVPAPCTLLLIQGPDFQCGGALAGLNVFLQWVLMAKSGVLPLTWFAGEEYRRAAGELLRPFTRYIRLKNATGETVE